VEGFDLDDVFKIEALTGASYVGKPVGKPTDSETAAAATGIVGLSSRRFEGVFSMPVWGGGEAAGAVGEAWEYGLLSIVVGFESGTCVSTAPFACTGVGVIVTGTKAAEGAGLLGGGGGRNSSLPLLLLGVRGGGTTAALVEEEGVVAGPSTTRRTPIGDSCLFSAVFTFIRLVAAPSAAASDRGRAGTALSGVEGFCGLGPTGRGGGKGIVGTICALVVAELVAWLLLELLAGGVVPMAASNGTSTMLGNR
jgi:hypothetical protein